MRLLSALFALLLLVLVGCGGGGDKPSGGGSRTGSATVKIAWPEPSRLVPVAANSIRLTLKLSNGTTVGQPVLIARPTRTASFFSLKPGVYTVVAEAFRETVANVTDASVALAKGSAPLEISTGESTFSITMGTTIARFRVDVRTATVIQTFYLSPLGAVDTAGTPLASVPDYPFADKTGTFTITPQARLDDGSFAILLLTPTAADDPVGPRPTIVATLGAPFTTTTDYPDSSRVVINATLPDTATESDSSLAVTYTEPASAGNVLTFRTPISVNSGTPSTSRPTVSGLTASRRDGLYRIHATLQETSVGNQFAQQDFPVDAGSQAVTLSFDNPLFDDGGQFTLTVVVQVQTAAGGYVDLFRKTKSGKLPNLGNVAVDDAFDTSKTDFFLVANQSVTVTRGGAALQVKSFQAKVGDNASVAVPAALFKVSSVSSNPNNDDNRIAAAYDAATDSILVTPPTKKSSNTTSGTFTLALSGGNADRGTVAVSVTPNGGGIDVGIG